MSWAYIYQTQEEGVLSPRPISATGAQSVDRGAELSADISPDCAAAAYGLR